MVAEQLRQQIRWFVLHLLRIRLDTKKTPSFSAPIILNLVEANPPSCFENEELTREKAEELLATIARDNEFKKKFELFDYELTSKWSRDGKTCTIFSFDSTLLRNYLSFRIIPNEGKSIFSNCTSPDGGEDNYYIRVFDTKTKVRVKDAPQRMIFCFLIKNPGQFFSYSNLFEELRRTRVFRPEYLSLYDNKESEKKTKINEMVNNLRKKLRSAAQGFVSPQDPIIENNYGGDYSLRW